MPLSASEIARRNIAKRDTDRLVSQAIELGIDIPRHDHWWWDDSEELIAHGVQPKDLEHTATYYLTPEGIGGLKRLIRLEKQNKIEWWIKTLAALIAAATGLVGALIGLQAMRRP